MTEASREVRSVERTPVIKATPAAKQAARRHGVELVQVVGSGPSGRIIESDVLDFIGQRSATGAEPPVAPDEGAPAVAVESQDATAPKVESPSDGRVLGQVGFATRPATVLPPTRIRSVVPITGARRVMAVRMFQSVHSAARCTQITEVDVSETVRMRAFLKSRAESKGIGAPTYTDIFVKIAAQALRDHPIMNSRLGEEEIQILEEVNVGVAVAGVHGLTVAVVNRADEKSIEAIAVELRDKVERARVGRLYLHETSGGSFTVSNLGMYEIDDSTQILNPPEVGILHLGRILEKPAVVDGQIVIRSMMHINLTYDHRVVDGPDAAAFTRTVKRYLENPYGLVAASQGCPHG